MNKRWYLNALMPFIRLGMLVFILLTGCEENGIKDPSGDVMAGNHGIFILNEGNFNHGSASLSYIDRDTDSIQSRVFYKANGYKLGDVAYSMIIMDSLGYVVVNNSGKIELINIHTFKSAGSISGFTSPRHICPVSDSRAYVSDLYETHLYVIDLNTRQISGRIPTGAPLERMIMHGEEVFAAFWSKYAVEGLTNNKVLVINTRRDTVVDRIEVGIEPNSMVLDKNNTLWVLCSGGYDHVEKPALYQIHPEKRTILNQYEFPNLQGSPERLVINPGKDTLYYINTNVYQMPVQRNTLPAEPFIYSDGRLFYALGISGNSRLFLSDAKNFQERGAVMEYDSRGEKQKTYEAGIIPTCFRFH